MSTEASPFFSIIIPTRNRASLCREALESAVAQTFDSKEIIVVSDGSTGDELAAYTQLERDYPSVQFRYLIYRPDGHGASYSRNYGAQVSCGRYLCFLDDDDYWTDPEHLDRAFQSIGAADDSSDLYFTNQDAYFSSGEKVEPGLWISDLKAKLGDSQKDEFGTYVIAPELMVRGKGFPHLNCSIFRREFYEGLGGLNENLRYEEDRDIFIRSMDVAELILFNPMVVSYHRIPDAKAQKNLSTSVSEYTKHLSRLAIFEKGCIASRRQCINKYCTNAKGYQLKLIAEALYENREYGLAARYAAEAMAFQPGIKWFARMGQMLIKSMIMRIGRDVRSY